VGTLEVVLPAEVIELPLLPSTVGCWRAGGLRLHGPVHSFMRSVLLRAAGGDALVNDAELDPPDVELAETVNAGRGKGYAVVATDGVGQATLAKQALEGGAGPNGLHVGQAIAAQKITAEVVHDRQRVAVPPVAGAELPFEVDGPDLVRRFGTKSSGPWVQPSLSASSVLYQPMTFEDVEDGASARERRWLQPTS